MSTWRDRLERGLARLFAPPCLSCGRPVPRPFGGAACDACWAGLGRFSPPCCVTCGVPLTSWRVASIERARCARCRRRPTVLTRQAAIGPHEGALRDIVHALKYEARRSTAAPLAALMRDAGAAVLDGAHVVVPVPLHPWRGWTRGFNQSALLAGHLGPPVASLLARTRATPPQVSLPAARRHRNVRDAFAIRPRIARRTVGLTGTPLSGLVVVLVDDVCTTGATLDACGRALVHAGVGEVRALTASRSVAAPRR